MSKGNNHPPEMPAAANAQYFHLPEGNVVIMADNSQTGRNDLLDKGADADRLGIIKARKVDKCT